MEAFPVKEVYFKSVLIADIQKKTARRQDFSKGLNVITSSENHVGKSSLIKSLYYALGADVGFDAVWDRNTKLYVVSLCVDDKVYQIARQLKSFAVFEDGKLIKITDSVTKGLAPLLEKIFDFSIYLPNKQSGKMELAPPAFTFMPYYIDQDTGWTGLYDSFSFITQYQKDARIKSLYYHLNIYTKATIELMVQRDKLKNDLETLQHEDERLCTVLEALQSEAENVLPAQNIEELEEQLALPKERIESLVENIGRARNRIQRLEMTLHQHEYQLKVILEYHAIKDSIDPAVSSFLHVCPNCGYTFDEEIYSLVRRNYNLVSEKYMLQQVQLIIDSIAEKLRVAKEEYVALTSELNREETSYHAQKDVFDLYIRQRGLRESMQRFTKQLSELRAHIAAVNIEIKDIQKQLKKLPNKKEIEEKYIELVRLNIMSLDAWNPEYDGKIQLLKPIKVQGTLENKIILAQYVGLFQTMEYFQSTATRFSFVVDFPRAKEASVTSSKDILKMITEMRMLPQIILATMDYSVFQNEIDTPATIITLTEKRRLLSEKDYQENESYIVSISNLLKNYLSGDSFAG